MECKISVIVTTAYDTNVLRYSPIIAFPVIFAPAVGITINMRWKRIVPVKAFVIVALDTLAPPINRAAAEYRATWSAPL